jgi:hypothetical protein
MLRFRHFLTLKTRVVLSLLVVAHFVSSAAFACDPLFGPACPERSSYLDKWSAAMEAARADTTPYYSTVDPDAESLEEWNRLEAERATREFTEMDKYRRLVATIFQWADRGRRDHNTGFSALPLFSYPIKVAIASDADDENLPLEVYLHVPQLFSTEPSEVLHRFRSIEREFFMAFDGERVNEFRFFAEHPDTGEFVAVTDLIPQPESEPKYEPTVDDATIEMARKLGKEAALEKSVSARNNIPAIPKGFPAGALSGKTVYINQAHGWFDDFEVVNRYRVQRGDNFGVLEDFDTAEFINHYVLPALRNAGAKVQTVRESDLQTNMVIVDNADGTSNPSNGTYVETGAWANSSLQGFRQKTGVSWNGKSINPFAQGAGQNRLSPGLSTGAPTATATWTANIPEDGYYNVYVSWTAFSGRANDAQYFVHHSGGVTEFNINQKIDGVTWFLLGNFYFEAGSPEDERKVVLTNVSNDGSAVNVSADAVRWGGGMGDMARQVNGVSGRPRWEEEAVLYLQYIGFGASGSLYTGNDDEAGGWSDRAQYARWEHSQKDGSVEDAIYFAWHTNAFNGSARGLSTFRHGTATAASTTLQTIMHDAMYDHIEGEWFPGWTVRSKNVTNFGENNQNSLGTGLPGFLIEGLFHDNQTDTETYSNPRFRRDYARAIVHAVIEYFEDRDTINLTTPPETPTHVRAEPLDNGGVRVSWNAPENSATNQYRGDAATSYIIFQSSNGFGFDNGTPATGNSHDFTTVPSGEALFYRVVAVNAGGWSFPSETVAAVQGGNSVLLVNGFDRNDRSIVPTETITNAGSNLRRDNWRNYQAFNYVIEHAKALAPHGVSVSTAANESVIDGDVLLSDYAAVFWILGEESTADSTFDNTEQNLVTSYLGQSGTNLFLSGAEIGWDLDRPSGPSSADRAFYNNALKADYAGDDANTYNLAATSSGVFDGLPAFNFNPSSGAHYNAEFPDVLSTTGGSQVALSYSGGAGTAAISFSDANNKVINLGFPFELISSEQTREDLMGMVVDFFELGSVRAPQMDFEDSPLTVDNNTPPTPGNNEWSFRNWTDTQGTGGFTSAWLSDANSTFSSGTSLAISGTGDGTIDGSFGASYGEWINPGDPAAQFEVGKTYSARAAISINGDKDSLDQLRIGMEENTVATVNQTYVINAGTEVPTFDSGGSPIDIGPSPFLPATGVSKQYISVVDPLDADLTGRNDGNPANDLYYLMSFNFVNLVSVAQRTGGVTSFEISNIDTTAREANAVAAWAFGSEAGDFAFDGSNVSGYTGWDIINRGPLTLVGGSQILLDAASTQVNANNVIVTVNDQDEANSPENISFHAKSNFTGKPSDIDVVTVIEDAAYRVDFDIQMDGGSAPGLLPGNTNGYPSLRLRGSTPIPTFSIEYVMNHRTTNPFPTPGTPATHSLHFVSSTQFADGASLGEEDNLQLSFGIQDFEYTDGSARLNRARLYLLGVDDPNVDY